MDVWRKTVGELKTPGLLICQQARGKLIGHGTRRKYLAVRFMHLKNVQAEGSAARNSGCTQPRAYMLLPAVKERRPGSRSRADRPCPGCCLACRPIRASTRTSLGARVSRPRSNPPACTSAPSRPGCPSITANSMPAARPRLCTLNTPGKLAHSVFKRLRQRRSARDQVHFLQNIEHRQAGGASQPGTRAGAAVHQLGQVAARGPA